MSGLPCLLVWLDYTAIRGLTWNLWTNQTVYIRLTPGDTYVYWGGVPRKGQK